ncbi:GDP-fucose protein O-fucosyltransferase [Tanacetum coccineum]
MRSHQHDHYLELPESDTNDSEPFELQQKNHEDKDKNLIEETCTDPIEVHTRTDQVHHRVTILNYSEEVPQPINKVDANIETEITSPPDVNDDSPSYKLILPWINEDGTINEMVYKGLVRRALGSRRNADECIKSSRCYYGCGEKESKELGKIRKRWKTLHSNNPDKERRCPLTPEEVGLMVRALGYSKDVHLYVASGEVYGGDETIAPLRALFPNIHSKDAITTKDELEPFSKFSSRMAALDFIVCDESDVFVTNNNGNMAKNLAGRRRYFGHKPTIRTNAKKLYRLLLNRENTTWEEFSSRVRTHQRGFMGEPKEVRPGRDEFHENPARLVGQFGLLKQGRMGEPKEVRPGRDEFHENPATCICDDTEAKSRSETLPRKFGKDNIDSDEVVTDQDIENQPEVSDQDEDDDLMQFLQSANETNVDDDPSISELPELEELLSD